VEYAPGDIAPATGDYELLNVFGSRTGRTKQVKASEPLSAAPHGWCWRRLEADEQ
jgi:hypothetical protein